MMAAPHSFTISITQNAGPSLVFADSLSQAHTSQDMFHKAKIECDSRDLRRIDVSHAAFPYALSLTSRILRLRPHLPPASPMCGPRSLHMEELGSTGLALDLVHATTQRRSTQVLVL